MLKDQIAGTIAGMMLGDSMGMPGELWPKERIDREIGKITDLIDGPKDNDIACEFFAGQFTDDSSQALIFLDEIIKCQTIPSVNTLAESLIKWAEKIDAFTKNILGMSSKAALQAHRDKVDYTQFTSKAETNGAAMRISPLGCIIPWNEKEKMAHAVAAISSVTHSSDVAVAGASMVAQSVASAIAGRNFDEIIQDALEIHDIAIHLGAETYSASTKSRLLIALDIIKKCKNEEEVSKSLYDTIGTGVLTSESVPTAIAIAYYCKNPEKSALMCANLGGDTDTIGAMATAICGAYTGVAGIRSEWRKKLEKANNVDINKYADSILTLRNSFRFS